MLKGVHWEHVNNPQALVAISTCNHIVWVVGRKGELYYREDISKENPSGTKWKLIETPKYNYPYSQKSSFGAKSVSLTTTSAWVVLSNGGIAVRSGISRNQQDGKEWNHLTGKVLNITLVIV